jgi:hypothetical protein
LSWIETTCERPEDVKRKPTMNVKRTRVLTRERLRFPMSPSCWMRKVRFLHAAKNKIIWDCYSELCTSSLNRGILSFTFPAPYVNPPIFNGFFGFPINVDSWSEGVRPIRLFDRSFAERMPVSWMAWAVAALRADSLAWPYRTALSMNILLCHDRLLIIENITILYHKINESKCKKRVSLK